MKDQNTTPLSPTRKPEWEGSISFRLSREKGECGKEGISSLNPVMTERDLENVSELRYSDILLLEIEKQHLQMSMVA